MNSTLIPKYILEDSYCNNSRTSIDLVKLLAELALGIFIVFANLLVIISITISKILRKTKNLLILSLSCADFLVGIIIIPVRIYTSDSCSWIYGKFFCYVVVSSDIGIAAASILSLTSISLDRYFAIVHPFKYRTYVTNCKVRLIILIVWSLAFLVTVPSWGFSQLYIDEISPHENKKYVSGPECIEYEKSWHLLMEVLICHFLPLTLLIFVQIKLWRILSIRRNRFAKAKNQADKTLHNPSPTQTIGSLHVTNEALQTRKGQVIIAVLLCCFIICWTPLYSLLLSEAIIGLTGDDIQVPNWVYDLFLWSGYINSCLNPLIYTMVDKNFRYVFKELICLRWKNANLKKIGIDCSDPVNTSKNPRNSY